jgi:TolB-like protein
VVSKDELLDTIWNGRIVSEAALSSRINAARRAVGDDGDRQARIKTIHRRGFRFVGTARLIDAPAPATEEPTAAAPVSRPQRRKPSVAVLRAVNLSQEPDTEYFTYGMTEDIIRLLARNRWLDVLSRHSTMQFQGRDADAREVGQALAAQYLVQIGVFKRGERVRITADLVWTETSRQLWSDSYDLTLPDIFAVQETMAQRIAAVIEPELGRVERGIAARRPPDNLDAWDGYQRGLFAFWASPRPASRRRRRCSGAPSRSIPALRGRMARWPMSISRVRRLATPTTGRACWRPRCRTRARRSPSTTATA